MSGESAMAVRYADDEIEVAAGHPASLDRARLLRLLSGDFARTLVSSSAGVIGGAKPVALFSFAPARKPAGDGEASRRAEGLLREVLCAYGRGASALGLHVEAVGAVRGRTMLLAWRRVLVEAVLADPEKRAMLAGAGFRTGDARSLMSDVRARLASFYADRAGRRKACFPHELGVLFGYPVEDVRGFMNGQKATCRGPWCAYGDADEARRKFAAVERCEHACRARFRSGERLGDIVARPWNASLIEGAA